MSIYGDSIFESTDIELTSEEIDIIKAALNESSEDVLHEGTNIEITKAFMTHKKACKKEMRAAKKSIYDRDEALEHIANAKKELRALKKVIKDTDSSVGSTIFGFFANALIDICDIMLPISIAKFGENITAKSIASGLLNSAVGDSIKGDIIKGTAGILVQRFGWDLVYAKAVIVIFRELVGTIKAIKDDQRSGIDKANIYKNKIITYVMDIEENITKTEKYIKNRKW